MNTMDKSNDFLGFSQNCLLISFAVFLMFVQFLLTLKRSIF